MNGGGQISRRSFEGLFGFLRPEGAFADELRAAGWDPAKPADEYPLSTWRACLEVARRHRFGDLPREEGERRVGRAFTEGFGQTVVGQVFRLAAPMLGPERVLSRLPSYVKAARDDVTIELDGAAQGGYLIKISGADSLPHFLAGTIEKILELAGSTPKVVVVESLPDRCTLHATWT